MKNFFNKIIDSIFRFGNWFSELFTSTVEVAPGVRKPKKEWSKVEEFYVAELRSQGVTRRLLRKTIRELRAHGCRVWLFSFPGRWYSWGKTMGFYTTKGKFIQYSWE